ncbi:hypothetical protein HC891_28330 [Candidatus Gracilibacteria bacterium]|nr:hypothetical protein [Candidatus Gracilibacteria bacterium]
MDIEHIALLQTQRELHDIPRGFERFRSYLDTIFDDKDDPLYPMVAMNPMGKPHVAERLDTLLALGADAIAAEAAAEAAQRLAHIDGSWRTALVICDDLMGGWTNRYLSEANARFSQPAKNIGTWIPILLWTGEEVTPTLIAEETKSSIYRRCYTARYGSAASARQMMRQEGLALHFAGANSPTLDADDLDYTREVLRPLLDATDYPTAFTCMYGDVAARSVGYPPLGLSPHAGSALALADARASGAEPVDVLRHDRGNVRPGLNSLACFTSLHRKDHECRLALIREDRPDH